MAKKIKRNKAGIAKRQLLKREQKASKRKQQQSKQRPPQSQQKKAMQVVMQLPKLAFHEVFKDFSLDSVALQSFLKEGLEDPFVIQKLATEEVVKTVLSRIGLIIDSLPSKSMLAMILSNILELWGQKQVEACTDPVFVALYLKQKLELQGSPVDESQIITSLEEYLSTNESILEQFSGYEGSHVHHDGCSHDHGHDEHDHDEHQLLGSARSMVLDDSILARYYDTLTGSDEEQNRMQEDVEVFLEDFLEEPLTDCTAEVVRKFINRWFVENLNPLDEDVKSMRRTLFHFFEFAAAQKLVSSQQELDEILVFLQKN